MVANPAPRWLDAAGAGNGELMELPPSALAAAKERARFKMRGHAMPPGTGPKDETCGSCQHYTSVQGGARTWPKCGLARARWTGGSGSDIRKKDPACSKWEPKRDA